MLNIDEIRQLIKLIDESSINEFTYENEGSKVELKKQSGTVQTIQQVAAAPVQAPAPVLRPSKRLFRMRLQKKKRQKKAETSTRSPLRWLERFMHLLRLKPTLT